MNKEFEAVTQYSDVVNTFRQMAKDEFFNVTELIKINRYFKAHHQDPGA